jgi:xylulokinase
MYWLGLDIGTGGSRALLVDSNGHARFAHTTPHREMTMARPLWAEQEPVDWWRAAQAAIHGVLRHAGVDGSSIRGVGLSGQMHGLVILDDQSNVIRPSLIWCDQRSQAQVDYINATVGREKVLGYTANPVLTGFTLPKLLWVRDHEPENYTRVKKMLLPKDYVRFHLTGEFATEVSDASGTSLFDVVNRRWSLDMANALGIDAGILPRAFESSEVTGLLSATAAAATGLKEGTPVVGGGGDQAASAIGNGIVAPGSISCTVGTSGVVFGYLSEPAYDPAGRVHTFCHAVPGAWHVMGVTQGAGLSLQWFRNRLVAGAEYDDLTAEATLSPPGAQGLFWLPHLMGERTPHLDPLARAAWVGLTAKHNRADLIRSILEGVSYSQRDCLELIEGMGCQADQVRLSGGGATSPFWHQLFADVFGKRVVTLETKEGSAYGAALLAMVGSGEYSTVAELCRGVVHETSVKAPDKAVVDFYKKSYNIFRSLYPALKPVNQAIAALGA